MLRLNQEKHYAYKKEYSPDVTSFQCLKKVKRISNMVILYLKQFVSYRVNVILLYGLSNPYKYLSRLSKSSQNITNLVKYYVFSTLPSGKQLLYIYIFLSPTPFDQYLLKTNNKNVIVVSYFFVIRICLLAKI